jgi:hypothetical protein
MRATRAARLLKAGTTGKPNGGYSCTQILVLLCRSGVQALSGELRSPDGAVQVLTFLT